MKCPKCNRPIQVTGGSYTCKELEGGCGFRISRNKFDSIVGNLYNNKKTYADLNNEEDNQKYLNNLEVI